MSEMPAVDWLLESDPAIRWQTLADLMDAPANQVAAERARVAREGWGAQLMSRQASDGSWGGRHDSTAWDATNIEWNSLLVLLLLRDLGVDPNDDAVRAATTRTAQNVIWKWWDKRPFFHGEVEPCINGRVLGLAAYYGHESGDLLPKLLTEQMADGGWNCEQERGATTGSFHSTINVLEGLLEHELAYGATTDVTDARHRGHDYLLERRLLRRLTTGELIDPEFSLLSFPPDWHYDVLRALEYLRRSGLPADERMAEAIDVVRGKRRDDGRWILDKSHPDQLDFDIGQRETEPSRWITLRATRVLRWADRA